MNEKNKSETKVKGLDAVSENLHEAMTSDEIAKLENFFLLRRLPTLNKAMQDAGVDQFFDLDRFQFIANHLFGPDNDSTDPVLKMGLYDERVLGLRTDPVNPEYESASRYLDSQDISKALDQVQFRVSSLFDRLGNVDINESHKARKAFTKTLAKSYSDMLQAHPIKCFNGKDKSEMISLVFAEQLCQEFDQTLNLEDISYALIHQINKDAINGNLGRLETLFEQACAPLENSNKKGRDYSKLFDMTDKMNRLSKSDGIFLDEKGGLKDYLNSKGIHLEDSDLKRDGGVGSSFKA